MGYTVTWYSLNVCRRVWSCTSVFGCVCVLCMWCVCVGTHMFASQYVLGGVRRQLGCHVPQDDCPPYFKKRSPICHLRKDDWPEDPPTSLSHPRWDYKCASPSPALTFLHEFWGPNSGPPACKANPWIALPTAPSPQLTWNSLRWSVLHIPMLHGNRFLLTVAQLCFMASSQILPLSLKILWTGSEFWFLAHHLPEAAWEVGSPTDCTKPLFLSSSIGHEQERLFQGWNIAVSGFSGLDSSMCSVTLSGSLPPPRTDGKADFECHCFPY